MIVPEISIWNRAIFHSKSLPDQNKNPALVGIKTKMYNKTKDMIGVGEYLCQMILQTRQ